MSSYIGVLIATRNRPAQLSALLSSLMKSTVPIYQIVVVSSGDLIDKIIQEFSRELPITHFHSELPGQIRQKMYGIKLFHQEIEWVLNLDDDLILDPSAITHAIDQITTDESIVGVGFALPSTKKLRGGFLPSLIAQSFGLAEKSPGKILKNGHASSYLQSSVPIETQWLNSATMWRKEVLVNYQSSYLEAKYAAYEDVIFSYTVSKTSKLFFQPLSKLTFQEFQPQDVTTLEAFRAASFWRLYFVKVNPELSLFLLIWSQLGRSLDYTFNTTKVLEKRFISFFQVSRILFSMLRSIPTKNPTDILRANLTVIAD